MLKMTIDNEEVVSKNDFTIKEEMQTASSTILNNTYPKSWEQDKDYTSRFYYPKDYAKLNIQNFTRVQEAEAGTTVQINGSATLTDVDTTKNSRVMKLLGQTSQSGTPTPTLPQPVHVVSGDNEISICGKNLLPQDKYITTTTKNGITYTNNGDGTFNLTGTASANTTIEIIPTNNIQLEANHSYYLYSSVPYNGTTFNMSIPMTDNGSTKFLLANNTYTPTTTPTNVRLQFYIASGQSINQTNIKLMLVKGSTAPTTYEPYIGNTYPINLGVENLFDGTFIQGGVDFGSTGADIPSTNRIRSGFIQVLPNTTYTISSNNTNLEKCGIGLYKSDNSYDSSHKINAGGWNDFPTSFTTQSDTKYIKIAFRKNDNSDITPTGDYEIQLELGSKANHYTPYGTTPIELCKIGTYQDYIYKDNGSWYLHKEIGKYTFDSTWSYSSVNNTFQIPSSVVNTMVRPQYTTDLPMVYCNYLSPVTWASSWATLQSFIAVDTTQAQARVRMSLPNMTLQEFQTWLTTHEMFLYYVLATPTTTQITDTTLINQLDNLESS